MSKNPKKVANEEISKTFQNQSRTVRFGLKLLVAMTAIGGVTMSTLDSPERLPDNLWNMFQFLSFFIGTIGFSLSSETIARLVNHNAKDKGIGDTVINEIKKTISTYSKVTRLAICVSIFFIGFAGIIASILGGPDRPIGSDFALFRNVIFLFAMLGFGLSFETVVRLIKEIH